MAEKEKPKNLYQKLLEIQKQVIGLGKDKSALSYKYVTGDKVLSHIKPLMNSLGILLKQEVLSIENTRQDYTTKNGTRSEIHSKVMLRFTWIDTDSNEREECLFGANGQNDWERGVPSAMTLGERYFLLKFFHIATDEDDIDNPERKAQEEAEKNMKQTALDLVKASKMDEAAKNQWTTWITNNTPAAIAGQMENLNKQIAAFQS
jgi:hypothetical protein